MLLSCMILNKQITLCVLPQGGAPPYQILVKSTQMSSYFLHINNPTFSTENVIYYCNFNQYVKQIVFQHFFNRTEVSSNKMKELLPPVLFSEQQTLHDRPFPIRSRVFVLFVSNYRVNLTP